MTTPAPSPVPEDPPQLRLATGCAALTLSALYACQQAGWVRQLDGRLEGWLASRMAETFPRSLPPGVPWMAAALVALILPVVLIACPRGWQRLLLWGATTAVLAAWAPVLCLAAHRPEVSLVLGSSLFSGSLVLILVAWRHRRLQAGHATDHETS